jgi:hypothetical protein
VPLRPDLNGKAALIRVPHQVRRGPRLEGLEQEVAQASLVWLLFHDPNTDLSRTG